MAERYRQEITDWDCANHIYITEGRVLLGYIPRGSNQEIRFMAPKKQWSPSHRKFRDLSKTEVRQIKDTFDVRIQEQTFKSD